MPIDKLLLEKIPLAGIARVTGVSERWLQKYETIPQQIEIKDKPRDRLTIKYNEMWSFVTHKGNKQWIWLAMDGGSRDIVGLHIGNRDKQGAQGLCNSLPPVYR